MAGAKKPNAINTEALVFCIVVKICPSHPFNQTVCEPKGYPGAKFHRLTAWLFRKRKVSVVQNVSTRLSCESGKESRIS